LNEDTHIHSQVCSCDSRRVHIASVTVSLSLCQFRGAVLFVAAFFSILLFDHDLEQKDHANSDHILSDELSKLCPRCCCVYGALTVVDN